MCPTVNQTCQARVLHVPGPSDLQSFTFATATTTGLSPNHHKNSIARGPSSPRAIACLTSTAQRHGILNR